MWKGAPPTSFRAILSLRQTGGVGAFREYTGNIRASFFSPTKSIPVPY